MIRFAILHVGFTRQMRRYWSVFHVSGAGWGVDQVVRWMSGLEGSGKELFGEQGEGFVYGENLGFCVKVPSGGSLHVASSNAEGGVLEGL